MPEIPFGLRAFLVATLDSLNVLSLPALRAFGHIELHRLPFLQALETARLNSGEMHEDILATLTADKAIAFRVIEPLYCSLFCHLIFLFRSLLSLSGSCLRGISATVRSEGSWQGILNSFGAGHHGRPQHPTEKHTDFRPRSGQEDDYRQEQHGGRRLGQVRPLIC